MNARAPEPKPKRSRRMVVWLVAVPIVILLLALAGANWKVFHLAYAKHLIASEDAQKQRRGLMMVVKTHLRESMSLEEVRLLLEPAKVAEIIFVVPAPLAGRSFSVSVEGSDVTVYLGFDENDRLLLSTFSEKHPLSDILLPSPRK